MECEHCKKFLSTKSALNNHQKTVKYCLAIQGKDKARESKFKCEYCYIAFTSNNMYKNHINNSCKEKYRLTCEQLEKTLREYEKNIYEYKESIQNYKQTIQEKDIIIAKLQTANDLLGADKDRSSTCIEEMAKQPKTRNSTKQTLNMLTPLTLTQNEATTVIDNCFDNQYFYDGQKGAAKFAVDNLLTDSDGKLKYVCTDSSRQIFKFKNEDGDMKKDIKAKKLTEMLMPGLKYKAMSISKEEFNKYSSNVDMVLVISTKQGELRNILDDNTEFRNELSALTAEK